MWKLCKKLSVFIVLVIVLFGYGMMTFKKSDPHQENNVIILGLESSYPPFEFMDSEGDLIGFDVDVAKLIAEKLGKKLVIKDLEFEGLLLSLKQGKIDLIMSGMEITPSRLKEIEMIPYHGEKSTSLSLIFWGKIQEGIQTLEDIAKDQSRVVSVESGTLAEAYLLSHPSIQMKSFQGALAPLMDVKMGKSVADLVEADVASYLKAKHPEVQILTVPLKEDEKALGFGIGVKKGNEVLSQQINSIVEELKRSGKLKELEEKWFKEGV